MKANRRYKRYIHYTQQVDVRESIRLRNKNELLLVSIVTGDGLININDLSCILVHDLIMVTPLMWKSYTTYIDTPNVQKTHDIHKY